MALHKIYKNDCAKIRKLHSLFTDTPFLLKSYITVTWSLHEAMIGLIVLSSIIQEITFILFEYFYPSDPIYKLLNTFNVALKRNDLFKLFLEYLSSTNEALILFKNSFFKCYPFKKGCNLLSSPIISAIFLLWTRNYGTLFHDEEAQWLSRKHSRKPC